MGSFKFGALVQRTTSTVSSGTTLTLVKNSTTYQRITGTSTQLVKLPDATTLVVGMIFTIQNRSTGDATVNDGSNALLAVVPAGTDRNFQVYDVSTAAGVWVVSASSGNAGIEVVGGGQVSYLPGVPPTPVTVSNLVQNGNSPYLNTGTNNSGQPFLATVSGTINSFAFALYNQGAVTGNMALQIYSGFVSGSGGTGLLGQSLDFDCSTLPTSALTPHLQTFTFSSPINLVSGNTYYAILVRSTGFNAGVFGQINAFIDSPTGGPLFFIENNLYNPGSADAVSYYSVTITPAATNVMTFTSALQLEFEGLDYPDNNIPTTQSPVTFPTPGRYVAWVIPNTSSGGPDLTVSVSLLPAVPHNAIIIARVDANTDLIVGNSTRFKLGESKELYYVGPNTGGGAGDDLDSLGYSADFADQFADPPSSPLTSVDVSSGHTNAVYSATNKFYTMSYDASQSVTGTGTSMHLVPTVFTVPGPVVNTAGPFTTPGTSAQTFTATANTDVVSFSFNVNLTVTGSTGTVEAYIYEVPAATVITLSRIPSQALGHVSIPVSGLSSGPQDLLATFSTPVPILSGHFYLLAFGNNSSDLTYSSNLGAQSGYAGGQSYESSDYVAGSYVPEAYQRLFTIVFDAPLSFTVAPGDILRVGTQARAVTAIGTINTDGGATTPFTIEAAFTTDPTAAAATLSQAVYTKDINNFVVDGDSIAVNRPDTIGDILATYNDTVSGRNYNYTDPALIAYTASSDGTNYCVVTLRTADLTDTETITGLPTSGTDLFLRFFSSATSGSGIVNLTNYKAYFHRSTLFVNGGIMFESYTNTDGSGTQINCSAPFLNGGGQYQVTLSKSYPINVNPGKTTGSLRIELDGKGVDRFVDSVTTPDTSYVEIDPLNFAIISATNILLQNLSLKALQWIPVIDTNTNNTNDIVTLNTEVATLNTEVAVLQTPAQMTVIRTTGGGTYLTPAGAVSLTIRMVGAGGSGGAAGTSSGTAGNDGTATSFDIFSAGGGLGGASATVGGQGGAGGGIGLPPNCICITGSDGGPAGGPAKTGEAAVGGTGGCSPFGGAGGGGYAGSGFAAGSAAAANSGSGGGGSTGSDATFGGGGGGSGAYFETIITSPGPSYTYSVGQGGAPVSGSGSPFGTSGAGGDGMLIIVAHFAG